MLQWKLVPERWGGGRPSLLAFKAAWVRYHRQRIVAAAERTRIPSLLLAGVAFIEVGGDPTWIDRVAFETRSFDWLGPGWVDRNITITNPPSRTSFGSVSIQLRRAAQTLGLDADAMNHSDQHRLIACLQTDRVNIDMVARHLRALVLLDSPTASADLSDDAIRLAASRYNRGPEINLERLRQNTSYGDFILRNRAAIEQAIAP